MSQDQIIPPFSSEMHDKYHKLMKEIWRGNFISPIIRELTSISEFKVLDVGCGSGAWVLQLSEDYPLTKFVGLDKLPIFPKEFSRNNLQFIQGDILKGLPFENDSFDFVHVRMFLMYFTQQQLEEKVIKELVRVCKPGGWIEIVDHDTDGKSMGPVYKRIVTSFVKYFEFNGINSLICEEIPEMLEATDQVETVYSDEMFSAIGSRGGETGKLALETYILILNEFMEILPKRIGISKEEYEMVIDQFIEEIEHNRSYSTYQRFCCQKKKGIL